MLVNILPCIIDNTIEALCAKYEFVDGFSVMYDCRVCDAALE